MISKEYSIPKIMVVINLAKFCFIVSLKQGTQKDG
jgi:hypothetical protein